MDNIYLVGFMGTGKSAVGKELSFRLKRAFIDLDELIESKEGLAINEIFQGKGEAYFRALEKKFLEEVSLKDKQIISCGGGIVIDPENILQMKNTGTMVCLTSEPEVILKRTSRFSHRPLLNCPDPLARIRDLLAQRRKFYSQADITLDTSDISVKEAAAKLLKAVSR